MIEGLDGVGAFGGIGERIGNGFDKKGSNAELFARP